MKGQRKPAGSSAGLKAKTRGKKRQRDPLRTRPVSWTSPPVDDPAIRDSRMEETSEAAGRVESKHKEALASGWGSKAEGGERDEWKKEGGGEMGQRAQETAQ